MRYKILWLLAIVFMFADMGTTMYGLSQGHEEGNSIASTAFEHAGIVQSMVVMKAIAFAVAYVGHRIIPEKKWLPPLILSVAWGAASVINTLVILA